MSVSCCVHAYASYVETAKNSSSRTKSVGVKADLSLAQLTPRSFVCGYRERNYPSQVPQLSLSFAAIYGIFPVYGSIFSVLFVVSVFFVVNTARFRKKSFIFLPIQSNLHG